MKFLSKWALLSGLVILQSACGQTTTQSNSSSDAPPVTQQTGTVKAGAESTKENQLNLNSLHPTAKQAIEALQAGDKVAWFALFAPNSELFDDGNAKNFQRFEAALGHERFTSVDRVENNGLTLYGNFHSDQWGEFKTYFKFHLNAQGQIDKLEIGQAK